MSSALAHTRTRAWSIVDDKWRWRKMANCSTMIHTRARARALAHTLRDGIAFGAHECFALSIRRDFVIVYVIPPSHTYIVHALRPKRNGVRKCRYVCVAWQCGILCRHAARKLHAGRWTGQDYRISWNARSPWLATRFRFKIKNRRRKMVVILENPSHRRANIGLYTMHSLLLKRQFVYFSN